MARRKCVTNDLCEERRGSFRELIDEKFKAISSQIKIGFSVATLIIVAVELALKFA